MMANERLTRERFRAVIAAALDAGVSPAEILMRWYAGRRIPCPSRTTDRDQRVRALLDAGYTYSEVATEIGLSLAHVKRLGKRVS